MELILTLGASERRDWACDPSEGVDAWALSEAMDSVVALSDTESGVVVDSPNGIVLCCAHALPVASAGGHEVTKTLTVNDAKDLALVRAPSLRAPQLTLGAGVALGEVVAPIAAPWDHLNSVVLAVTESDREGLGEVGSRVQIDSGVPSGGALVNNDGELIGLTLLSVARGGLMWSVCGSEIVEFIRESDEIIGSHRMLEEPEE